MAKRGNSATGLHDCHNRGRVPFPLPFLNNFTLDLTPLFCHRGEANHLRRSRLLRTKQPFRHQRSTFRRQLSTGALQYRIGIQATRTTGTPTQVGTKIGNTQQKTVHWWVQPSPSGRRHYSLKCFSWCWPSHYQDCFDISWNYAYSSWNSKECTRLRLVFCCGWHVYHRISAPLLPAPYPHGQAHNAYCRLL